MVVLQHSSAIKFLLFPLNKIIVISCLVEIFSHAVMPLSISFCCLILLLLLFIQAISERGKKLGDIADSTARMKDSASAYEEAAREAARRLREKYANRKWWQI